MHRPMRSIIIAAMLVVPLAAGCQKDDGAGDAATTDTTAMAPAAPTPPAELAAANDAFKASWNAEDDAATAAMYTDSATVQEDTMRFAGRAQIQEKWIKPNLKDIQQFSASDETWSTSGADFAVHGRYALTVIMDKKPVNASGTYDSIWTKGADGTWRISSMVIHSDPPPPPATTTSSQ